MHKYIAVAIGGLIGTILRYIAYLCLDASDAVFPWATVTVNLIGSFLLATTASFIKNGFVRSEVLQYGISAGVLASFTTFSNFGLDVLVLQQQASIEVAGYYIFVTLTGGGLCTYFAWRLTEYILRNRGQN